MEKQLQFIKHKGSVALSLFLLLANQMAAQAGAYSDKTKWLTNNLEKTNKSNSDQSLITLKALSAKQDHSQKPTSIIVSCSDDPNHTIKLRPFMSNRKLPSRHDLELALIEQKAKLAEENNARLNGQISTFVVGDDNNQSYTPPRAAKISSPAWQNITPFNSGSGSRNYNHQTANKSVQAGFSLMRQAEQHLLSSGKQQMSQYNSFAIPSNPEQSIMPSASTSMTLGNPQSAAMNSPIEDSGPSAFSLPIPVVNSQTLPSPGFGTAGPPPFPLNLLPEASLKQLIKGLAGHRTSSGNAPKVAFGSWHSPSPLNSVSGNRITNLPYAGFQSHLVNPNTRTVRRIYSHRLTALPAVTGKQKTHDIAIQKDTSIRNRMLSESQVRVAVYPTYATQSLKLWNFAQ